MVVPLWRVIGSKPVQSVNEASEFDPRCGDLKSSVQERSRYVNVSHLLSMSSPGWRFILELDILESLKGYEKDWQRLFRR